MTSESPNENINSNSNDQSDNQPSTENIQEIDNQNPELKDKFIIKFSLPTERNFECKPNMNVSVSIKI